MTYFIDERYKFHLIKSGDFENLAAIVLEHKYGRLFHVYKEGPDGGVDAQASNIGNNDGNSTTNEKIIVQVKHTGKELGTLDGDIRKKVFEKEIPKVEKLVEENRLETYVIVTNYQLPALQAEQLEKCFTAAGAKKVEIFGYETLCNLLNGSLALKGTLIATYPVINPASMVNTTVYNQCTINRSPPSQPSKSEPDIKGTVLNLFFLYTTLV